MRLSSIKVGMNTCAPCDCNFRRAGRQRRARLTAGIAPAGSEALADAQAEQQRIDLEAADIGTLGINRGAELHLFQAQQRRHSAWVAPGLRIDGESVAEGRPDLRPTRSGLLDDPLHAALGQRCDGA